MIAAKTLTRSHRTIQEFEDLLVPHRFVSNLFSFNMMVISLRRAGMHLCNSSGPKLQADCKEQGVAYHLWASIRRTHRAVIFNFSRTDVTGKSLYFSSSAMGRMLANQ